MEASACTGDSEAALGLYRQAAEGNPEDPQLLYALVRHAGVMASEAASEVEAWADERLVGTINNEGTIKNTGTINNNDIINNYCGSVFIGSVISNQAVDLCQPLPSGLVISLAVLILLIGASVYFALRRT